MDFKYITQEDREKLYNEVWTDPVIIVAERYGMSDNGLRKHCRKIGIPLPQAGYWAKLRAGKKVYKPELPKVTGELKKFVHAYAIKYRQDVEQLSDDELVALSDFGLLTDETVANIKETSAQLKVKDVKEQVRNPHNLINEHKEEIAYRKKRDKDLGRASSNTNFYNYTSSKYRSNNAILPFFCVRRKPE